MNWLERHLPKELPGSWDETHGWTTSWLLPCITIGVVALYVVLARPRVVARLSARALRSCRRALFVVLSVTALFAALSYHDFGLFRYDSYLNEWDYYHYYLGTKYAREIGYMDLYSATLVADEADGLRYDNPDGHIRDLATVQYRAVDEVLAERDRYRGMFSPERWREFVADVSWFKMQLPRERWSIQLTDHGYNGTPVWTFLVRTLFTGWLSIRDPIERAVMLALDPILLVTLLVAIGWAFGPRTALLVVVFVGTHYFLSWGHLKGSLVRTDFAVALALAVCFVREGWYRLAGVCLAWSILSRVFPVVFLAGPIARLAWIGFKERRLHRELFGMLVSCAATGIAVTLTSLVFLGPGLWAEWIEKITEHYEGLVHWNVGYQAIFDTEYENGEPVLVDWAYRLSEEPGLLSMHVAAFWSTALIVLVPAVVFSTALRDDEALCFGFVFMFFTVQAAYYYLLVLVVPFLFFASAIERPSRAVGAIFMLLTGMAGYLLFSGWERMRDVWVAFQGWNQTFGTTYYMSWLLCFTALYMVALGAAQARRVNR